MPNPLIIRSVMKHLSTLEGWPKFRVLDLSCGEGEILQQLHQHGCKVEGTHFREDDYILRNPRQILDKVPIHTEVDLTRPLPFEDGQYDIVLATEVIEHLPNHSVFVAEAARMVKPGGYLILTTPNVHRLSSRLRFLLTGQHEVRGARLGWEVPGDGLYSTHHNLVYFPVLHTLLYHQNLRITRLRFSTCKPIVFLFAPFLPLFWISALVETRHALKRSREGGQDLRHWLTRLPMYFSDQLVLCARKDR